MNAIELAENLKVDISVVELAIQAIQGRTGRLPPENEEIIRRINDARVPARQKLQEFMLDNGLTEPYVIGKVTRHKLKGNRSGSDLAPPKYKYSLTNLRRPDGSPIQHKNSEAFIFAGNEKDLDDFEARSVWVRAKIAFNDLTSHSNSWEALRDPLGIHVVGMLDELDSIPRDFLNYESDGGPLLLSRSIIGAVAAKRKKEIQAAISPVQQEHDSISKKADAARADLAAIQSAIAAGTQENAAISAKTIELQQLHSELISTTNANYENLMNEYEKLRAYAQERAETLLQLGLIDENQQNELLGITAEQDKSSPPQRYLDWDKDLGKSFKRTVSAIQAFLMEQKGLIYPRWLVENFLTLLRTNDLIILAGLSGSGKTKIVEGFAEALGGKHHIVPVKPNWTSSEDLLGFYNPMQGTYIRSYFLDALLEAKNDPEHLHIICLDEMNLARAEYYFADFLSKLEDRKTPKLELYSANLAAPIQTELRILLYALEGKSVGKTGKQIQLEAVLEIDKVKARLEELFGSQPGESFPEFFGRIRRQLHSIISVPDSLPIPANVRFVGTVNMDQTTHNLSPKILDRAHVIRFDNPLKYDISAIEKEIASHANDYPDEAAPVAISIAALGEREPYPEYNSKMTAAQLLQPIYVNYLDKLGVDIAFRTIRQSQLFWDKYLECKAAPNDPKTALLASNLIVKQKILPRLMLDGKVKVIGSQNEDRYSVLVGLRNALEKQQADDPRISAYADLVRIIEAAESSDKIINYWN